MISCRHTPSATWWFDCMCTASATGAWPGSWSWRAAKSDPRPRVRPGGTRDWTGNGAPCTGPCAVGHRLRGIDREGIPTHGPGSPARPAMAGAGLPDGGRRVQLQAPDDSPKGLANAPAVCASGTASTRLKQCPGQSAGRPTGGTRYIIGQIRPVVDFHPFPVPKETSWPTPECCRDEPS